MSTQTIDQGDKTEAAAQQIEVAAEKECSKSTEEVYKYKLIIASYILDIFFLF